MCNEHAAELDVNKPAGPADDYTLTPAFKLLANDPNARVVVSCEYWNLILGLKCN